MSRYNPTRPSVIYPAHGKPGPEALQGSPMATLVEHMAKGVEEAGGRWTSAAIRDDEDPSSAAIHFILGGKRYVGVIQPLDMPDRARAAG